MAWCLLQVKLCDPCLSAVKWFVYHARHYTKCSAFISDVTNYCQFADVRCLTFIGLTLAKSASLNHSGLFLCQFTTLVTIVILTCCFVVFFITDTEQQFNSDAASGRYVLTLGLGHLRCSTVFIT